MSCDLQGSVVLSFGFKFVQIFGAQMLLAWICQEMYTPQIPNNSKFNGENDEQKHSIVEFWNKHHFTQPGCTWQSDHVWPRSKAYIIWDSSNSLFYEPLLVATGIDILGANLWHLGKTWDVMIGHNREKGLPDLRQTRTKIWVWRFGVVRGVR